jgi:SAM-dependent methyltransferase
MSKDRYLRMQKEEYRKQADRWTVKNLNPIVGSYNLHNKWPHWQRLLFDNINTSKMTALEYGCGVGRNIILFKDMFKKIDGIDISEDVIKKAIINLDHHGMSKEYYSLYVTDGSTIKITDKYDLVFSVICLQHICCHSIRIQIMSEIYKVLKPGGIFTFQMGFGDRKDKKGFVGYYDDFFRASKTNGKMDVSFNDKSFIEKDLTKIGFHSIVTEITDPSIDRHSKWIFVRCRK